jgi:Heavy metal binding domain
MQRTRRSLFFISILLLAGCGSRDKPSRETQAATAAPRADAAATKHVFRGDVLINADLRLEASVTQQGVYTIGLHDARGYEIPASTISNLSLELKRPGRESQPVNFKIDSEGEYWIGSGVPLSDSVTTAAVALSFHGENVTASLPLSRIDAQADYVCPMHPDSRAKAPGVCPRCGMKLVLGLPKPVPYPLEVTTTPARFTAGQNVRLKFAVKDPRNGSQVQSFEVVHERLFHLFILSSDLKYFVHDHPEVKNDGTFEYNEKFPKPGMYRVVADFYPTGGTPQLIPTPVAVLDATGQPVPLGRAKLAPDTGSQSGENTAVELVLDPPQPRSGEETSILFRMQPSEAMERYLGAWAHILIASDDLVDLVHEHPSQANGGAEMLLRFAFPRPRTYRLWLQFQRHGVVNTVAFNIPAQAAKAK